MHGGITLVGQAIMSVISHYRVILRIVVPVLLIVLGIAFWILDRTATPHGPWLTLFVFAPANLVLITVVTIGWHRFVLLNETPNWLLPRAPTKVFLLAFVSWVLISVVVGLVLMVMNVLLLAMLRSVSDLATVHFSEIRRFVYFALPLSKLLESWIMLYGLFRLGMGVPHMMTGSGAMWFVASRKITRPHRFAIAVAAGIVVLVWKTVWVFLSMIMAWIYASFYFSMPAEFELSDIFEVQVPGSFAYLNVGAYRLVFTLLIIFSAAILTRIYQITAPPAAP